MGDLRVQELGRPDDLDRLPWLEAVEEEEERGPSAGKLIGAVLLGLLALAVIVGGAFWLLREPAPPAGAEPELIAAPDGPYKVKPDDPGGMEVEGEGDSAFAASEGADPKGRIDVAAIPEAPVAKATPAPAQPQPQPTPPAPEPQAAAPVAGGGTVQLGAFSSQAAANAAWKALSGRFAYLEPLAHSVTPVTTGGRTLYRLRASGPGAREICGRLSVAGEQCVVVR